MTVLAICLIVGVPAAIVALSRWYQRLLAGNDDIGPAGPDQREDAR